MPVHQRVINISSPHTNAWLRQFPNGEAVWDGWRFVFNEVEGPYDYLVVFDDLHTPFELQCDPQNTIHLATEPPSFHHYAEPFLSQFAWAVTQDKGVKHPGVIYRQPGMAWFLGWNPASASDCSVLSFEELEKLFDLPKTKLISVIASSKTVTSGHAKRLRFAKKLKQHYGDQIDFYGRGFKPMDDKLEALQDYRFNVVLENSSFDDYFSEKFTDCVIAGAYPLYHGCPNLERYYPAGSFARIDIGNFDSAVAVIDQAIAESWDKLKRQELRVARDLTMHKHNLFPMLIELITDIENGKYGKTAQPVALDEQLLPFRSERYKKHFAPLFALPSRERLSSLANDNAFFGFLRRAYQAILRWM